MADTTDFIKYRKLFRARSMLIYQTSLFPENFMKIFCSDKDSRSKNLFSNLAQNTISIALANALLFLNADEDASQLLHVEYHCRRISNAGFVYDLVGLRIEENCLIGALVDTPDTGSCFFVLESTNWTNSDECQNKLLNLDLPSSYALLRAGTSLAGEFGTAAFNQCITPEGRARFVQLNSVHEGLNAIVPSGIHSGKSAAYMLCENPDGLALLRQDNDLACKISAETLNAILPQSAGVNAGKSAAYFLCGTPEGLALLGLDNGLACKISGETLNARLPDSAVANAGESAAYFLCGTPEGLALLAKYPSLAGLINAVALNARLPDTAGTNSRKSAAYYLCRTPDGRALLAQYPSLASLITSDALNARLSDSAKTGKSAAYYLCRTPDGLALLGEDNGLAALINHEVLKERLPGFEAARSTSAVTSFFTSPSIGLPSAPDIDPNIGDAIPNGEKKGARGFAF